MIRYALICAAGHDFEAWFRSSTSFDLQSENGQVECPVCGATNVAKAMMAPTLGKAGLRSPDGIRRLQQDTTGAVPESVHDTTIASGEPERQARAFLRAVRAHVMKTAEDVGRRFPEEARRMHYGETASKPIYGQASVSEARALMEEGIGVAPLLTMPDDLN